MDTSNTINLLYYLFSPELQRELLSVKIVFIFFSLAFFVAILFFLSESSYIRYQFWEDTAAFVSWKPYALRKIINRWEKIKRRIELGSESEYKLAIIEADDFLGELLKRRGYEGKSFEERLSKVEKTQISDPDEVIKAHKIRNSIIYDPDYKLSADNARNVLSIYEKTLREIETF